MFQFVDVAVTTVEHTDQSMSSLISLVGQILKMVAESHGDARCISVNLNESVKLSTNVYQ